MRSLFTNIFRLGVKELQGLLRDPLLLALIVYVFTLGIYIAATATPDTINRATIAVVDEDRSQLSERVIDSLTPPMFQKPKIISHAEMDNALDHGIYTFVIDIPYSFQKDLQNGLGSEIQLNVDATRMSQAFTGSGYIQQIIQKEVGIFFHSAGDNAPAQLVSRNRFNPNLTRSWFGGVVQLINEITMLAIILTGAALIRERENGTLEHLLVMPVNAFEIMVSKIWSMALVVLIASGASLMIVIKGTLQVPIEGSIPLFLAGVALHLFAVTSMGIFLACITKNMPQLGMLIILVLIPMEVLSGGFTPRESMPVALQHFMQLAPTTQMMEIDQLILFRGAGFDVVYQPMLKLFIIGGVFFVISLSRFRRTMVQS